MHAGTKLEREPGTCQIHTQVLFGLVMHVVHPSLFIPSVIQFAFPFLPLDPAVTMGTMFTVAFHWLLEKLLFPFPLFHLGHRAVRGWGNP